MYVLCFSEKQSNKCYQHCVNVILTKSMNSHWFNFSFQTNNNFESTLGHER